MREVLICDSVKYERQIHFPGGFTYGISEPLDCQDGDRLVLDDDDRCVQHWRGDRIIGTARIIYH